MLARRRKRCGKDIMLVVLYMEFQINSMSSCDNAFSMLSMFSCSSLVVTSPFLCFLCVLFHLPFLPPLHPPIPLYRIQCRHRQHEQSQRHKCPSAAHKCQHRVYNSNTNCPHAASHQIVDGCRTRSFPRAKIRYECRVNRKYGIGCRGNEKLEEEREGNPSWVGGLRWHEVCGQDCESIYRCRNHE